MAAMHLPLQAEEGLAFARRVLREALAGHPPPPPPETWQIRPSGGVFTTLRTRDAHRLRGCMGVLDLELPLGEKLVRATLLAAFHDPRFPPLHPLELDHVQIELSFLTPPERLPSDPEARVASVRIGTDGLILTHGHHRGLLLPEVPVEMGWTDPVQFLEALARKAGLPPDAWKDPEARLERFQAVVFREA